jgi:hypothetical protein
MIAAYKTPQPKKPKEGPFEPLSDLEHQLIAEYLLSKGWLPEDLHLLPEPHRQALMKEACMYASLRLAKIEAMSSFREKIRPAA